MNNLKQFAEKETERIEAENKKHQTEQNLPGFHVLAKGENKLNIMDVEVREKDFGDGPRKIFRIKTSSGEEKDWAVNPRNPVYRNVVQSIKNGKTSLTILRTGEGKATRLELLDK